MNCRKKKKNIIPIGWKEEPKIVLSRNRNVYLERSVHKCPGGEIGCWSRRLTLVTNPMISHTTPFSHYRLHYGFNCYHNSDACCYLRP